MRDRIVNALMAGEDLSPAQAKSLVGLGRNDRVNFEDGPVPRLFKGYPIDRAFDEAGVGPAWRALAPSEQDEVLESLGTTQSDAQLKAAFTRHFPDAAIESIIDVALPGGYGNAGATATRRLIEVLKSDVVPARVAQDRAGLVHAMTVDAEPRTRLPYYGEILTKHTAPPMWVSAYRRESDQPPSTNLVEERFGRIPNPVVHVALNQIRKTVNEVIAEFGCPASIHVELSRSLLKSPEERDRIATRQAARKEKNEQIAKELRANSVSVSRRNIQRYRLWEEQSGICVYTGECIGLCRLFEGDVDVDHVIPRSYVQHGVSLKAIDAMSNRVVCLRSANADKGGQTPYEAFGEGEDTRYDWAAIQRRASTLSDAKQKRFNADTRDRFTEEDGFRGRDGTDNAYIARITRQYLACLYGDQTPVTAVTAHLVALLRGKWGVTNLWGSRRVGTKSRDDHRHHYIDALVAACASRRVVQAIHTEAARCEGARLDDVIESVLPPFGDRGEFIADVKRSLDTVLVSRKSNHSKRGQLHEDLLLGTVASPDEKGRYITIKRKSLYDYASLDNLLSKKIERTLPQTSEIDAARKRLKAIQESVERRATDARSKLESENEVAVAGGRKPRDITKRMIYRRAVDLHRDSGGTSRFDLFERRVLVNLRSHGNQILGGYVGGRNHRVEFYVDVKGKVRWETVSMFDANRQDFCPQSSIAGNRLLWSAYKDDVLLLDNPESPEDRIRVLVAKFKETKIGVVPINDARAPTGAAPRTLWEKGLSFFCRHRAQRIRTNALGEITYHFESLPRSGKVAER